LSPNAHDGFTLSRKDDWISYTFIIASMNMKLPWIKEGLRDSQAIKQRKLKFIQDQEWKGNLPREFDELVTYVFEKLKNKENEKKTLKICRQKFFFYDIFVFFFKK